MSAYLVLLRVEVAAFHPAVPADGGLVSVALFLALAGRRPAAQAGYSVRALPGTLLCGARTFLHAVNAQRPSSQLHRHFTR